MPFPPPPQPAPPVPSTGLSQSGWAYGYVHQAGWPIPPNTIASLATVEVGQGTWLFWANISAFIDPKMQSVPWTADLHKVGGTAGDYYGGTTGKVANMPAIVPISVLGIGAFSGPTTVELRYFCWGATSLVATQQFDSGPTTLLVAQRVSDLEVLP